jgi:hypothetical protein
LKVTATGVVRETATALRSGFVIIAERLTVNLRSLLGPAGFVTIIRPEVAPEGTFTVNLLDEFTTSAEAGTPLKVTVVAEVKYEPVITTLLPTGPTAGQALISVGAGSF